MFGFHRPDITDLEKNTIKQWFGRPFEYGDESSLRLLRSPEPEHESRSRFLVDAQRVTRPPPSEGLDDFYQRHVSSCISEGLKDLTDDDWDTSITQAAFVKAMKGLHRAPMIPCRVVNGVLCVDLQASTTFLQVYFGELQWSLEEDGHHVGDNYRRGLSPFLVKDDRGAEFISDVMSQCESLLAFQDRCTSQVHPYYPSSEPLPFFVHDDGGQQSKPPPLVTPGGRTLGGGGPVGGGSVSNDAAAAGSAAVPPTTTPPSVNQSDSLSKMFECFICCSTMVDPATLVCGHSGCLVHLKEVFAKGFHQCPLCKADIPRLYERSLTVNVTLRDAIVKFFPETAPVKRVKVTPPDPDAPPPTTEALLAMMKNPVKRTEPDFDRLLELDSDAQFTSLEAVQVMVDQLEIVPLDDLLRLEAIADPRGLSSEEEEEEEEESDAPLTQREDAWKYDVTNFDFQRILRRGGVLAENSNIYDEFRGLTNVFMRNILEKTLHHKPSTKKLVTADDVIGGASAAGNSQRTTLLGFGGSCGVRKVWSSDIYSVLKLVHPGTALDPKALSVMNDIDTHLLEMLLEAAIKSRLKAKTTKEDCEYRPMDYSVIKDELIHRCSETVRLYTRCEPGSAPDSAAANEQRVAVCITADDVQRAVLLKFNGEIQKHAVSLGHKAVTKFAAQSDPLHPSAASLEEKRLAEGKTVLQSASELQFCPEQVVMVANRLNGGFPLTAEAAVYLTAVLDYMTGEILELSGNAARDKGSRVLGCQHIQLAVSNDEELSAMFNREQKCVFREGVGVIPYIPQCILCLPPKEEEEEKERERDRVRSRERKSVKVEHSAFEVTMFSKATRAAEEIGAPFGIFVDPRTGLHMGVTICEEDPTGKYTVVRPLPVLDAMSSLTREQRHSLAEAALTDDERAAMKAEGFFTNYETVDAVRRRRIREIKAEQRSSAYIFPSSVFNRLVNQIVRDYELGVEFTAEAVESIQALTEDYLVKLSEDVNLLAYTSESKRLVVEAKDVQLARRIRGERS